MKIKLYSTAPNGHYRAGTLITNAGVEVETDGLTAQILDAINEDPRLVRPDNWADVYKEARAELGKLAPQIAKKTKA